MNWNIFKAVCHVLMNFVVGKHVNIQINSSKVHITWTCFRHTRWTIIANNYSITNKNANAISKLITTKCSFFLFLWTLSTFRWIYWIEHLKKKTDLKKSIKLFYLWNANWTTLAVSIVSWATTVGVTKSEINTLSVRQLVRLTSWCTECILKWNHFQNTWNEMKCKMQLTWLPNGPVLCEFVNVFADVAPKPPLGENVLKPI